jgi:hypothetical protein
VYNLLKTMRVFKRQIHNERSIHAGERGDS